MIYGPSYESQFVWYDSMPIGDCPVCEAAVEIDRYEKRTGSSVTCPECETELVVGSVDPVTFEEYAPEFEEVAT